MLIAFVCAVFVLIFALLIWRSAGQLHDHHIAHEIITFTTAHADAKALSSRRERPWFICCYCKGELHGYAQTLDNGDKCCSECYSRKY